MADRLSEREVRHVARLARLEIPDGRVALYAAQLGAVIGYIRRLRELNLSGIEPLAHVGEAANRLDADEPGPTLPNEVLMKMAPEAIPPFLGVPKVLDEGGGGA